MHSSFFPEPGPIPEPERHVAPEWLQPPEDEYPARIPVRKFLAQTDGTSLSVSHVDVYSTGIRIKLEWALRRVDASVLDWQLATRMGHFHGGTGDLESELRFGLAMANGAVVTTVDMYRSQQNFLERPDGWSLRDHAGGGGGGGESRYSGASRLWPPPPAGPIELVAEWRARNIPESRLVLDGSALVVAVQGVRSLWNVDR